MVHTQRSTKCCAPESRNKTLASQGGERDFLAHVILDPVMLCPLASLLVCPVLESGSPHEHIQFDFLDVIQTSTSILSVNYPCVLVTVESRRCSRNFRFTIMLIGFQLIFLSYSLSATETLLITYDSQCSLEMASKAEHWLNKFPLPKRRSLSKCALGFLIQHITFGMQNKMSKN